MRARVSTSRRRGSNPADDAANIDWARAAWDDLRRFSTGGTYVNFLTEDEGRDRIHAAYGPHYERLAP